MHVYTHNMRVPAGAWLVAVLFSTVQTVLAQTSQQVPGSSQVVTGMQNTRQPVTKPVGLEAAALPDDYAAYNAADSKIKAFEKTHGERVYLVGHPTDAILLPDGTIGYLLEWPPSEALHHSESAWVLIAHPVRELSTQIDLLTGEHLPIGSAPDGTYYGFAWFIESVPDVVISGGRSRSASLYETHPPGIEEWYAKRAALSQSVWSAAVQKWWANWDEWTDNLRAGELMSQSGLISECRETDGATEVTLKGDGTFRYLYRDGDRVTYEGVEADSPCDLVGQRVVVWTLPCGDEDPCIRKIEAMPGLSEEPKASKDVVGAETPVAHSGLVSGCQEADGATVVTVKGDGTFQFLYRDGDRVTYEGVEAAGPCDLVGKNVVVWTVACDEDGPCISSVEALPVQ